MAVEKIGAGKIVLKMRDANGNAYSENLGFAAKDLTDSGNSIYSSSYAQAIAAVASLMDASYIENRITYELQVTE